MDEKQLKRLAGLLVPETTAVLTMELQNGVVGEGVPHVAVAMDGNTTLRLNDARNLLRVIDDGIKEQQFTGFERMQPMPGFSDKLDDGQLRDLLHYLRQTWGGQAAELSPQQVSQLRSDQYITFGASTWSPGASAWNTAVAAAMPLANRAACAPCSSAAISIDLPNHGALASKYCNARN